MRFTLLLVKVCLMNKNCGQCFVVKLTTDLILMQTKRVSSSTASSRRETYNHINALKVNRNKLYLLVISLFSHQEIRVFIILLGASIQGHDSFHLIVFSCSYLGVSVPFETEGGEGGTKYGNNIMIIY